MNFVYLFCVGMSGWVGTEMGVREVLKLAGRYTYVCAWERMLCDEQACRGCKESDWKVESKDGTIGLTSN